MAEDAGSGLLEASQMADQHADRRPSSERDDRRGERVLCQHVP